MKKLFCLICSIFMLVALLSPFAAIASETTSQKSDPVLTKVTFNNCTVDEKFSPEVHEYGVTLEDENKTPTLKSYKIIGDGKIFVTYKEDTSGRQVGIIVTAKYDGGSSVYTFNYDNLPSVNKNSNANLSNISFENGYLYSGINERDSSYKVFVPTDLTSLVIYPATDDINAKCSGPQEFTIGTEEPKISITVTASDGTTKDYKFTIKRLELNMEQLSAMTDEEINSLVEKEGNTIKTEHVVIACAVVVGIFVLVVLFAISKRLTVSPFDDEEPEFYLEEEVSGDNSEKDKEIVEESTEENKEELEAEKPQVLEEKDTKAKESAKENTPANKKAKKKKSQNKKE